MLGREAAGVAARAVCARGATAHASASASAVNASRDTPRRSLVAREGCEVVFMRVDSADRCTVKPGVA